MPRVGTTRREYYLGIDPGQKGGIVLLDQMGWPVLYTQMPETELDVWNYFHFSIGGEVMPHPIRCVIEKVSVMPKQGNKSGFTFGRGYGALNVALLASGISHEHIMPAVWMRGLKIPAKSAEEKDNKDKFKKRLRDFAQRLVPRLPLWAEPRTLGKQLAIADALLMAEYCRRKHQGSL